MTFQTEDRTPYNLPYDANAFELYLRPLESILLITGDKQAPTEKHLVAGQEVLQINAPWELEFMPANSNKSFSLQLDELIDFIHHPDTKVQKFSGGVNYSTTFNLDGKGEFLLELGEDNDFISEVEINGKPVGVNWYGSRLFDVSSFVQQGQNTLKIKYTTTLWNKMRDTEQGVMFQKKFKRPVAPLKTSGLLRPVRILEAKG